MLRKIGLAAALCLAAPANAVIMTASVGFTNGAQQVARATVTYDLLTPGQIINFNDLIDFQVKIRGGALFTFADLGALDANRFVRVQNGGFFGSLSSPADPLTNTGGAVISATNTELTDGFFVGPLCGTACGGQAVARDFRNGLNYLYTNAGGVPEPATWALMLIGFGGVGVSLRRSRHVASCAA
jgi:hypothetical protein